MKCNGTYKHKRLKPQKCSSVWGCKWFDIKAGRSKSKPKLSTTADKCSEFIDPIEHFKNQQT